MFPILTELEFLGRSFTVQAYGAAAFAAMMVGLLVMYRNARQLGLDTDHLLFGFIVLLPPILIGGKVVPLLLRGELLETLGRIGEAISNSAHPAGAAAAWSSRFLMPGGSTAGAAIVGALGLVAYARYYRLPLGEVADAIAPALALGLPAMRMGCLLAGCCFGAPAEVPWAVVYTDVRAQAATGVPLGQGLHPSPVYEAVAALAIGWFLLRRLERRRASGELFAMFLLAYGVVRLLLAPLRGDAAVFPGALLWAAAASAGAAALLWLWSSRTSLPRAPTTRNARGGQPPHSP